MRTLEWLLTSLFSFLDSTLFGSLVVVCLLGLLMVTKYGDTDRDERIPSALVTVADIGALGYLLAQFISLAFSINRSNTLHYLMPVACSTSAYFALRLAHLHKNLTPAVLSAVAGVGTLVGIIDLNDVVRSMHNVTQLGVEFTSSLHSTLFMLGGTTQADCLSVIVCGMSSSIALFFYYGSSRLWIWILSCACLSVSTSAVLITFNRSIYFAAVLLSAGSVIFLVTRRRRLLKPAALLFVLVTLTASAVIQMLHVWSGVIETASLFRTASQQRSAISRLHIWRADLHTFAAHPIIGSGGGNTGLRHLAALGSDDGEPYSGRSFNVLLEIANSSGSLGLACCFVFIVGILIVCFKNSRLRRESVTKSQQNLIVLLLGIVAIFCISVTSSTIALHPPTMLWLYVSGALLVSGTGESSAKGHATIGFVVVAAITAMATIAGGVGVLSLERQEDKLTALQHEFVAGNDSRALQLSHEAMGGPFFLPIAYLDEGLLSAKQAGLDIDHLSARCFDQPVRTVKDTQLYSTLHHAMTIALDRSPNDALLWTNRGWANECLGNDSAADVDFMRASMLDAQDPAVHVGRAIFLEHQGRQVEAEREYVRAIEISPSIANSRLFCEIRARSPMEAERVLSAARQRITSDSPSPIRSAKLAFLNVLAGDTTAALSEANDALRQLPNLSYAWSTLASIHSTTKTGNTEMEFRMAYLLDPQNPAAIIALTEQSLEHHDLPTALEMHNKALSLRPQSVHASRSWTLYHSNPLASDDVLPYGLLQYMSPSPQDDRVCPALLRNARFIRTAELQGWAESCRAATKILPLENTGIVPASD